MKDVRRLEWATLAAAADKKWLAKHPNPEKLYALDGDIKEKALEGKEAGEFMKKMMK